MLDPATGELSDRTEVLLYAADKAEHVDTVVLPALERGEVVITDRYVDSTLAYQGAGRTLAADEVERVARWATHDLRPHLTVVLDLDPEHGFGRFAERDRIEGESAGVPRAGSAAPSSTWPPPTPTTTSCSTRAARPTRSRPRCGSGSSRCSVRRRGDDHRHRAHASGTPWSASAARSRRCAPPPAVTA